MLRYLVYFESVYRNCGIRPASEELGLSPSTLSRSVAKLEEISGKKLFKNFGDTFERTVYADKLYTDIAEPIFHLKEGLNRFTSDSNKLTIVAPSIVSLSTINSIFSSYERDFGKEICIDFKHFFASKQEAYRALKTRHIDFLIDLDPPSEFSLASNVIYEDSWTIFGSKNHFESSADVGRALKSDGNEKFNFAVMNWLGVDSNFLRRIANVKHNVKLVTDNYSDFIESIEKYPLRGVGAKKQIDKEKFYCATVEVKDGLKIYLIYDKQHYSSNPNIKWFVERFIFGEEVIFK